MAVTKYPKTRVPGEAAPGAEDTTEDDTGELRDKPYPVATDQPDTITISRADLAAMIAQQVAGAIHIATTAPAPILGENLPDAKDVKLGATEAPVLTKQGWLVPRRAFDQPPETKPKPE